MEIAIVLLAMSMVMQGGLNFINISKRDKLEARIIKLEKKARKRA